MDIIREQKKIVWIKRYWYLPVIALLGVFYLIAASKFRDASYVADRDTLLIGEVQEGEFSVLVRGPGTLVPKDVNLVTTNVQGKVDKINVKAGAHVQAGAVLVELSNPKVLKSLEETRLELEALAAEFRSEEFTFETKLLDIDAEVLEAELNYQTAKTRYDAETELIERGIGAASRVDYESSRATLIKNEEAVKTNKLRRKKMQANFVALKEANAARLKQMENKLQQVQNEVDGLLARATVSGVVQEMSLELGQQVAEGGDIAKLAQQDNLMAELKIQETQIRFVSIGQTVTIDTRNSKISGEVIRVDPVVANGVVQVDVALTGSLPSEARPDLSVEGIVEIARKENAIFVDRPVFVQGQGRSFLYKVNQESSAAHRVAVELGQASTNHIEVVNGLLPGDRIIVSDSSNWESHDRILIN